MLSNNIHSDSRGKNVKKVSKMPKTESRTRYKKPMIFLTSCSSRAAFFCNRILLLFSQLLLNRLHDHIYEFRTGSIRMGKA